MDNIILPFFHTSFAVYIRVFNTRIIHNPVRRNLHQFPCAQCIYIRDFVRVCMCILVISTLSVVVYVQYTPIPLSFELVSKFLWLFTSLYQSTTTKVFKKYIFNNKSSDYVVVLLLQIKTQFFLFSIKSDVKQRSRKLTPV